MRPEQTLIKPSGPRVTSGRGESKQDYATPKNFIDAVVRDWCLGESFSADLAATAENAKAPWFITPEQNSLIFPWREVNGLLWLNPPFNFITPWAKKCAEESIHGARIAMLVPASVDANWWTLYVHKKAAVKFVSPRVSFDGSDPYPKSLALLLYGGAWVQDGESYRLEWYEPWRWKP